MYSNLKNEIENIIEIVNKCPEPLQEKCFEILLNSYLKTNQTIEEPSKIVNTPVNQIKDEKITKKENDISEEEIKESHFHLVIRRLLTSNSITMKDINNLYYIENEKLKPLYDCLNAQKMSDSQIRIALLTAFENGYSDNVLEFNIQEVRERCKTFKCYDGTNFMAIFKRNKELFDNIEEKDVTDIKLSNEGRKKMVETLFALARGE